MQALGLLGSAFASILNPASILLMIAGVAIGIIFGSIPGLSASMAVALMLPLTFSMTPSLGMNTLVAVYIGGISGGLISAILLNMPGTASSIATCFDGHPMAKNGEAMKALGVGIVFSAMGSIFSFLILTFCAPLLADVALKFTPAENFGICFFALTMVAILSSGNMIRGLLAGLFGLMFTLIGMAPIDGTPRFTFGNASLMAGFDTLPTLIGIFAIADILCTAESMKGGKLDTIPIKKVKGFGFTMQEFISWLPNFLRSSLIGTFMGVLPGVGGSAASILAYAQAKNFSKHPELLGTGVAEGLVASETSNNGLTGGALIPLLSLGIPGDSTTAVLISAFMLQGVQVGPLFITQNPETWNSILIALLCCNILMFICMFYPIKWISKIIYIPRQRMYPVIIMICIVGAYATKNGRIFDVWALLIFGVIGYIFGKIKIPASCYLIGFILGKDLENYFIQAVSAANGSLGVFFSRPIGLFIWVLIIVSIAYAIYDDRNTKKKEAAKKANA